MVVWGVGELGPPGVLTLFTRLILNFWMVFGPRNDSANGSMIWNYYYVGNFQHFLGICYFFRISDIFIIFHSFLKHKKFYYILGRERIALISSTSLPVHFE